MGDPKKNGSRLPSESIVAKLTEIAVQVDEIFAAERRQGGGGQVGIQKIKNDRRRAMERVLVLLADRELRDYLTEFRRPDVRPGGR